MNKQLIETLLTKLLDEDKKHSTKEELDIIGKSYYIRAIPYHYLGRVDKISYLGGECFLELSDSTWVADSGRLTNSLKEAMEKVESSELEPIPYGVKVNVSSIGAMIEYKHKLPTEQK